MRKTLLQEIRTANGELRFEKSDKVRGDGNKMLASTIEAMMGFYHMYVDGKFYNLPEDFNNRELLCGMQYFLDDAYDVDLFIETALLKYYSLNQSRYDSLQYLVMVAGICSIMTGEEAHVMERKLLSMVPPEVESIYDNIPPQKTGEDMDQFFAEYATRNQRDKENILKQMYKGDIPVTSNDKYYDLFKTVDQSLQAMDDRDVQRFLREISNDEITYGMMGLSGQGRKRILNNLSTRLAIMLTANMKYMREPDIEKTARSVEHMKEVIGG